jgi:hypothetical protein
MTIAELYKKANGWSPAAYAITMEELKRFADLVVEAERERAALKTEEMGMQGYGSLAIAAAIRRGDQK